MAYRPMLRRAVEGILGEAEAEEVFRRLAEMEAVGAYLGDAKVLEDLGAFLREEGDRLGFYVFTLLGRGMSLTVRDSGLTRLSQLGRRRGQICENLGNISKSSGRR